MTVMTDTRSDILRQAATLGWTLEATGDALGVTRERARQLMNKAGLNSFRVAMREAAGIAKRQPVIKYCVECGRSITPGRKQFRYCSKECRDAVERRYHAKQHRERYQADPAFRAQIAAWRRTPEGRASGLRAAKKWQQAHRAESRALYAAMPLIELACLDCGVTVYRKEATLRASRRKGCRTPLCSDCRIIAQAHGRAAKRERRDA